MYITLQSVWISVDIPQLLLMAKVDEACPLVKENLSNVYRSEYIYKKVLLDSEGVPHSSIFLMRPI